MTRLVANQNNTMKNCLLLLSLLWLSLAGQAQEQPLPRERKPIQAEPLKSGNSGHYSVGTPKTTPSDSLAGETIAHCDAVILAIDNKVAHVQNDQEQHEKALANGWYDKMTAARARYAARREALIARSKAEEQQQEHH
jgi:hypothetical protein